MIGIEDVLRWLGRAWGWVVTHPWWSLGLFTATGAGVVAGVVFR